MGTKLNNILKYLISAALAVFLLYFSFKDVAWDSFWASLKSCKWEYVILSMFFGVLSFYFRGIRWRRLLLPIDSDTKLISTFNATNIGYLANIVLPRAGELIRCGYITKNSAENETGGKKASFDKVLGTVLAERLWDILTLASIVLVIAFVMKERFGVFISEKIFGGMFSGDKPVLLLLTLAFILFIAAGIWATARFKDKNRFFAAIWKVIKGIFQGFTSSLRMEKSWLFLLSNFLVWLMYLMTCASIIWALKGMDTSMMETAAASAFEKISSMNMIDALFLMAVGAISSLVPVPGGFGAFHYLVSLALTTVYGIPSEVGVIFATLTHESQVITQIICGGSSYIYETVRK